MFNVNIGNVVSCLSTLSNHMISNTNHAILRIYERELTEQSIINCLINEEIMGILKQSPNKFQIFYKHPYKELKYDLVIIIVFNHYPKCNIRVVTIYEQSVKRRVRDDD